MEVRPGANPADVKNYDTDRLRHDFLIQDLFVADEIKTIYSQIDRIIVGAATPVNKELVLEAGAMAKGGEIFVLDMGAPVKITTLAENLIRMYGKVPYKDVPIIFTGLRPGEKLFEELLMDEEGLKSTQNKKIFIGNQIKIDETDMLSKLEVLKKTAENNPQANCCYPSFSENRCFR